MVCGSLGIGDVIVGSKGVTIAIIDSEEEGATILNRILDKGKWCE